MRYVWTVQGDDPDYGQGDKYGIDGYLSPLPSIDPLTPSVLTQTLTLGRVGGIYLGHNWFPGLTGQGLAEKVNADYKKMAALPAAQGKKLRVMFNLEEHDPAKIVDCLRRWRQLQPNVNTTWSMEGNQGGWMGPKVLFGGEPSSFVKDILSFRVRLVPQLFTGPMGALNERHVSLDLIERGFNPSIVSPFYDGARLRPDDAFDGFVFTMGRLPWIA